MIKKIYMYIYYEYILSLKKRKEVLKFYSNKKNNKETGLVLDHIRKRKYLRLVPYTYAKKYKTNQIKLYKDEQYPYVIHKNKKLYFKKCPFDIITKRTYNYLLIEQDINSPHRYIDESFKLENNSVLFDVGSAEGIFALENIDRCKKVFLFECDEEWIKILRETFKPYLDKVVIIEKYIGNKNEGDFVTLDSFINEINEDDNIFIKMDIEGAEVNAISGAKKLIDKYKKIKLAICTYHNQDDEQNIRKMFNGKDYILKNTSGFLTPYSLDNFARPYFRRGLLRIQKNRSN